MMDNKNAFPSNSLAKNATYNAIYTISNILLPLITSIYASRILLPEGVGTVAFANTTVSYFVTLATCGIPAYGVRAISRVKNDSIRKNHVFTELLVLNGIATTLCILCFGLLLINIENMHRDLLLYLCCGIQLPLCYFNIDWLYTGEEQYAYITKRSIFLKLLSLAAIFLFVREKSDYLLYALITSLAMGINHIFNVLHAKKYVRLDFTNLCLKQHLMPLLYLSATAVLGTLYSRVDVTMLGSMVSNETVGYYSNGHKIMEVVITACVAITGVFLPRLSFLYQQDRKQFQELLDKGMRIIALISIPATVGLFLLAKPTIVLLYGPAFVPAGDVLRLFTPMILIRAFGDLLCWQVVISIGQERKRLPAAIMGVIANITLNALLIPIMQEKGATIASVITEFLLNAYLLLIVRRYVKIRLPKKEIAVVLLSTAVMAIAVQIVLSLPLGLAFRCFSAVAVGGSVYFLVNYLAGNEFLRVMIQKLLVRKHGQ